MAVVHIVLFAFKPTLTTAVINDSCHSMLALKDKCMHPKTNKPYIKSCVGGRDNSPEGHQHGRTHGFVMEFENAEDRDYYIHADPTHQEFIKGLDGRINGVTVLDFVPDVF